MDLPLVLERLTTQGRILPSDDWGPNASSTNTYAEFAPKWRGVSAVPTQAECDTAWNAIVAAGGVAAIDAGREKAAASASVVASGASNRLLRALAQVLVDEINALRQQVIGVATAVFNPGTMANATGKTSANIPVAGAAFGDVVDVAAPYTLAGTTATAYVAAAGQVAVRVHNGTGASVTLASGTWKVVVRRHAAMPDRTLTQAKQAIQTAAQSPATD